MNETIGGEGLDQAATSAFEFERSNIITSVAKALNLSKDQIELATFEYNLRKYKLSIKLPLPEDVNTNRPSLVEVKNTIAPILSALGVTILLVTFSSQEYFFDLIVNRS
ncbi:hypothetical protein KBC89_02895 [Candidatus Woesebacteria bacterium]|nr:hypothetical protein [Candidatus Woesebacteria bacterium]